LILAIIGDVWNAKNSGNGTGKAISANPGVRGSINPHGKMKKRQG